MAFPELFEWYDIAVKDNQAEQKRLEAERRKTQEVANQRRGRR